MLQRASPRQAATVDAKKSSSPPKRATALPAHAPEPIATESSTSLPTNSAASLPDPLPALTPDPRSDDSASADYDDDAFDATGALSSAKAAAPAPEHAGPGGMEGVVLRRAETASSTGSITRDAAPLQAEHESYEEEGFDSSHASPERSSGLVNTIATEAGYDEDGFDETAASPDKPAAALSSTVATEAAYDDEGFDD